VIACIEEPWLIRKILAHVRLRDHTAAIQARAPPADPQRFLDLTYVPWAVGPQGAVRPIASA
jgi:hypothetical protein